MSKSLEAQLRISALDNTKGAFDAIGARLDRLGRSTKASAEIDRLSKSLTHAGGQLRAIERFQGSQGLFIGARKRFRDAQGAVQQAARALASAEKPTRRLQVAYESAQKAVSRASEAYDKQKVAVLSAKRVLETSGVPINRVAADQKRLQRAIQDTNVHIERQRRIGDLLPSSASLGKTGPGGGGIRRSDPVRSSGRAGLGEGGGIRRSDPVRSGGRAGGEGGGNRRGPGGHGSPVAGVGEGAAAYGIWHGVKHAAAQGADYAHSVQSARNAGMTPHQVEEMKHKAAEVAQKVPTSNLAENINVLTETVGAFGTLHHALENLETVQRTTSVLKSAVGDKIPDKPEQLGYSLAKFFEIRGSAGDPERFKQEAGAMTKGMIFSRGNVNPRELQHFAMRGGQALKNYDLDYMSTVLPTLVGETGGDIAGTRADAWTNQILGKTRDKRMADAWVKLGLIDKKKVLTNPKTGDVIGWKPGAVKDTEGALRNPQKWLNDVQGKALTDSGVNIEDRMQLVKVLNELYRNQNANRWATEHLDPANKVRLKNDAENINRVRTTEEAFEGNLKGDPKTGLTALVGGLDSLLQSASSPLMEPAAKGLSTMASALQNMAAVAQEHPILAGATGGGVTAGALGGGMAAGGTLLSALLGKLGIGAGAEGGVAAGLKGAGLKGLKWAGRGFGALGAALLVAEYGPDFFKNAVGQQDHPSKGDAWDKQRASNTGQGLSKARSAREAITAERARRKAAKADPAAEILRQVGTPDPVAPSFAPLPPARPRANSGTETPGTGAGSGSATEKKTGPLEGAKLKLDQFDRTVTPKVDVSGLDPIDGKVDAAKTKLTELGAMSVAPTVDAGGVQRFAAEVHAATVAFDGLKAKAEQAISLNFGGGSTGKVRSGMSGVFSD